MRVNPRDIVSQESLRDYIKIRTTTQEILTRQITSYYEELLPNDQFLRVHRSFVVGTAHINALTETRLEVPGQTTAFLRGALFT